VNSKTIGYRINRSLYSWLYNK